MTKGATMAEEATTTKPTKVSVNGHDFTVLERFTSTVKYLRETIHTEGVQTEGEEKGKLTEPRFLTDAKTGSRIYLAPDAARQAVVRETK